MAERESEHGKKDTDGFPLRDHHVLFTNDRGIKQISVERNSLEISKLLVFWNKDEK